MILNFREVRKLIVPPELAYGNQGVEGIIPRKKSLYFAQDLSLSLSLSLYNTAKSTLVFHVEILGLRKKSLLSVQSFLPQGSTFYTFLGIVVLIVLAGYELYKRYTKQNEEMKQMKKTNKKKSKK